MTSKKAGKRVAILFYLLTAYILFQFIWWAYLLIDLNTRLYESDGPAALRTKILMVLGEGGVFLLFLLAGIFIMQRTIRKEILLIRQQRNFLLSITHELKTPLAAIKLCLETLVKRPLLEPEQRQKLQANALDNTERLRSLIDNVLLATRIESGQELINKTSTNLSELTLKTSSMVMNAIEGYPKVEMQVQEEVHCNIDPQNYESILTNLLENALKYGNDKPVKVLLNAAPGKVILEVSDQGVGIEDSLKTKIFEKFYRLGNEETRSKKGTGLGLFIVKELVDLNKGKISLRDNPGGGTTFRVELKG